MVLTSAAILQYIIYNSEIKPQVHTKTLMMAINRITFTNEHMDLLGFGNKQIKPAVSPSASQVWYRLYVVFILSKILADLLHLNYGFLAHNNSAIQSLTSRIN